MYLARSLYNSGYLRYAFISFSTNSNRVKEFEGYSEQKLNSLGKQQHLINEQLSVTIS